MPLSLFATTTGTRAVLRVGGRLDLVSAAEFRSAVEFEIEKRPARLVVDLADVDFMDSTGLGVLVRVQRKAQAEGVEIVLAAAQQIVEQVLRVTGVIQVLPLYPDAAAALAEPS